MRCVWNSTEELIARIARNANRQFGHPKWLDILTFALTPKFGMYDIVLCIRGGAA
jgi:hypothetical protein